MIGHSASAASAPRPRPPQSQPPPQSLRQRPLADLELARDNARMHVQALQLRRHHAGCNLEHALRTCSDNEFAACVGLSRGLFFRVLVLIAPALDSASAARAAAGGSSNSGGGFGGNCFALAPDVQLALFLMHVRDPTRSSVRNYLSASPLPLKEPLYGTTLRAVACAINDAFYSNTYARPVTARSDVVLAFQRIFGSSFARLHASIPSERATLSAATICDLLQLEFDSLPKSLRKSSSDHAAVPDRFRWSPSFLTHPVFDEKRLVNMHRMNPKVAIADETEILEYFESIMVKRFKSVSFRTSPYPLRDEQWIERYKITKELFAWLLEKLVPFLTPSENDSDISLTYFAADTKIFIFLTFLAFEIDSKFRDPIDTLLLDYFSNSLSRQEVIAVIMQVRDVILQRIYAHKYTHDLFALAFECVFGKFSFLYDAIPHRLRIQTSSPNAQQSNSSVIEKPKSCVSGAPPGTAVRNSTAVAEAWETGPSKRARVTSAESSVPRYGASAAQAQVRSAPPAVAAMHVVQGAAGDISRATILARTRRATLAVAQRLQHRRGGLIGAASGAGDTTSSSPPSGVVRDIRNWRTLLADDGERIELDGCEPILGTVPEDTAGEAAAASTLTVAAAPCDNVDYDKSDAEESGYVNDEDNDENAFDVEEEEEEAEEFADDEDGAEDEDNVENQENVENTADLDGVAEDEDEDSDAVDVFE